MAPPLDVTTIGSGLTVLVVGGCTVLGVLRLLHGDRRPGLKWFYRASVVALLFGQFFAFLSLQFVALIGLAVNLLVLGALKAELNALVQHDDSGR